jgi:vanillate/4-hydroxybenzoate decarboxylase subunit D
MTPTDSPTVCPRCRSAAVSVVAKSPVPDRWTMRSCSHCWYAWRSTEPRSHTDPEAYPEDFRLTATDIAQANRIRVV